MRLLILAAIAAAAIVHAPIARAEVAAASPSQFLLRAEEETGASVEETWRALSRVNQWWSSSHTYSGDARNMRLDLRADGCWCEHWSDDQSVEHGRVIMVMEREGVRTARLDTELGPLQELGVSGVLTFTIAPHASGAKVTMTYRVAGDAGLGLDQMAPLVDMVLMEQFGRLIRFSASGSAN